MKKMICERFFHFLMILNCSIGIILHRNEQCRQKRISKRALNTEEEVTECFEEPKFWCSTDTRYRTLDGRCNNLDKRSWGMANTAMFRVTAAKYEDGVCSIRKFNGNRAPSAEKLAEIISTSQQESPLQHISIFFLIIGQLISEDVTSIIVKPSDQVLCCSNKHNITLDDFCGCMETNITQDTNNCARFARSKSTHNVGCPVSPIHQLSSVSSFLDLSFLYSSNIETQNSLRSNIKGKLKVFTDQEGRPFVRVPQNSNMFTTHKNSATSILLTMFTRLHNFLCEVLDWLNPSWDDDKLFQEARRTTIAIYQHIVYYEFLPIILGYEYAKRYDLMPRRSKFQEFYDPDINPSTISSFATAAFRYFHQFMPHSVRLLNNQYKPHHNGKNFTYTDQNFDIIDDDNYDSVIRGLLIHPVSFSTPSMLEKRIRLLAVDIERTRDHGLTTYNDFREACGLHRIFDFEDLKTIMKPSDVRTLAGIYEDVDDIELYVGGVLEVPTRDALTGPTFQCLIAEAFYRYKFGDRFFYEHKDVSGQFSKEQLLEIKKVTGSLLICIASDMILKVQTNIFYLPSTSNPYVPCELILRPNFSRWQEKPERIKPYFNAPKYK